MQTASAIGTVPSFSVNMRLATSLAFAISVSLNWRRCSVTVVERRGARSVFSG